MLNFHCGCGVVSNGVNIERVDLDHFASILEHAELLRIIALHFHDVDGAVLFSPHERWQV